MDRFALNDTQWARIAGLIPGKPGDRGRSGSDTRLFLEAVLGITRTGAPWRDLPAQFGHWNSGFRRWAVAGVFERLFKALRDDPDFEYVIADGSVVKVHRHGQGARGGTQSQAIGRSRGGLTSKITALVDGLGNLVAFRLMPGQRHDSKGIEPLLDGLSFDAFLGDKAFNNDRLRAELRARAAEAPIPSKRNRKTPIAYDREKYKWRHLVETFFAKLKEFRRIATRHDNTDTSFAAMIYLGSTMQAMR